MPMTTAEFLKIIAKQRERQDSILVEKGPKYAGHVEDNRLANFEMVALLLNGAPVDSLTVCAVYWLKHVLGLCTYIRTRAGGSDDDPVEDWFADEANYNALMQACDASLREEGG